MLHINTSKGQSLLEILIALALAAIFFGAVVLGLVILLRSNFNIKTTQVADSLSQDYIDNIRALSESGWLQIYNLLGKGLSSQFYLTPSSTGYAILTGVTSTLAEGQTFTRYFSVENVVRDLCGAGNIVSAATTSCVGGPGTVGVAEDVSTQKITVAVNWGVNQTVSKTEYVTRYPNKVFNQTDWSGGGGVEGPVSEPQNTFASSTDIDYTSEQGSIKIKF